MKAGCQRRRILRHQNRDQKHGTYQEKQVAAVRCSLVIMVVTKLKLMGLRPIIKLTSLFTESTNIVNKTRFFEYFKISLHTGLTRTERITANPPHIFY